MKDENNRQTLGSEDQQGEKTILRVKEGNSTNQ